MTDPAGKEATYRPAEDIDRRYLIAQMTVEVGWLGKIFGSSANAPTNIAGFVVCLLTVTIIVAGLLLVPSPIPGMDFLNVVIPIITLALGYLFGKST
jgi:hypothetical protein